MNECGHSIAIVRFGTQAFTLHRSHLGILSIPKNEHCVTLWDVRLLRISW